MSTKFEQLLDYLVNEEHEKANELFHEIVVEKSRSIYENLIAEEEDEETDEAREEGDESVEESADDKDMDESADEEADESIDLEDSYMMDGEDDGFDGSAEGDATDDFGKEIGADDDHEKSEDDAIMGIKDAIAELEAAFAELEQAQGAEHSEFDDQDSEETDEMMGQPAFEGKRMTREYVEKVGNDWDKNAQKSQGQIVGKNTGDAMPTATEPTSMKWGNGKPTSGANAKNLDQGTTEGQSNTGTTPNKVNKGITPEKGEQYTGKDWETNSAPGGKAGVKNLSKVGDAKGLAGATKNNGSEGTAAGAGTGDNSVKGSTNTKSIVDKKIG